MKKFLLNKNVFTGILYFVVGVVVQIINDVNGKALSEANFGDVSSYIAYWFGIFIMLRGVSYFLKVLNAWLNAERDNDVYS